MYINSVLNNDWERVCSCTIIFVFLQKVLGTLTTIYCCKN